MRSRLFTATALIAMLAMLLPGVGFAQYGHPLKGQWSGEWGPPKDNPQRLLLDLQWDGKAITGVINPGANAATVQNVTFDYSNPSAWKVKLEAERKDTAGKPVKILVDGTLENLGAYFRSFHGTWTEGGRTGGFAVTRN